MHGDYLETSCIETNNPILVKSANKYMKNKTKDEIINVIKDWDIFKKQNWWESEAIDVEKVLLDRFVDKIQGKQSFEIDYDWADIEQCPTCGDLDGRVNPCCRGYDPLHINNCGFG